MTKWMGGTTDGDDWVMCWQQAQYMNYWGKPLPPNQQWMEPDYADAILYLH